MHLYVYSRNRLLILSRSCKLAMYNIPSSRSIHLIHPALLTRFEMSRLFTRAWLSKGRRYVPLLFFFLLKGELFNYTSYSVVATAHPSRGMKFQFVGVLSVASRPRVPIHRRFPSSPAALRSLLSGVDREIKKGTKPRGGPSGEIYSPRRNRSWRLGTALALVLLYEK